MVSPVPIHLGMNWCSHACFYCFANLNRPDRRGDWASVLNAVKAVKSGKLGKSVANHLLAAGHPVLASNVSDPFAKSNVDAFNEIKPWFDSIGARICYQTRGGERAIETLKSERPTLVYISVTSDQNDVIKFNEPAAPNFEHRKALIEVCLEAGHFVVVGMNPLHLSWWKDLSGFIRWLAQVGVKHVWHGTLHLSHLQIGQMTDTTKSSKADVIAYARKRKKPDSEEQEDYIHDMLGNGINVFRGVRSAQGHFWDPYYQLGFPRTPTLEGLLDDLNGYAKPVAFTFDWFDRWANMLPDLRASEFKSYMANIGRTIRDKGQKQEACSFTQVHEFMWDVLEYPSVLNTEGMHIARVGAEGSEDEDVVIAEAGGNDIFIYSKRPSGSMTYDLNEVSLQLT